MTTRPDDLALGQWLKYHRAALRLTQHMLAQRVGCTVSTLQKIERGVRRPSRDMLERIAEVLGVSAEERARILSLSDRPLKHAPQAAVPPALALSIGHQPQRHVVPAAEQAITSVPLREHQTFAASAPLLLTKILPPPPTRQFVPRSRLTAQLEAVQPGDLTLIIAPAGWGKTTLLTSWIARSPRHAQPVAWLSLDERDSDVLLVLRYLIAALQRSVPAVGYAALQLVSTPQPSVEAALTLLINDVLLLGAPLVLVLDDYHLVRAPAIHDALVFLIDQLPPNLHLVLASRESPPFPLTRLRAQQRLHELRVADLRFTPEETATFFSEVLGLAVPDAAVAVLEQRTEGWITGLLLAGLALREHADQDDFIGALTSTHRLVLDYLAEEVLAHLPPHLHDFLLHTSILDRLCGPLCDAVLGLATQDTPPAAHGAADGVSVRGLRDARPGPVELATAPRLRLPEPRAMTSDSYSQLLLDHLERANLFLVALDDQRSWYRYHHLFAVVLRERLQRGASAGMVAMLHERAARWFAAHGIWTDAIEHALAGKQWQHAAQLIEQIGSALLESGATTRLQEMIEALPPTVCSAQPRLVYLLGRCAQQVWHIEAARRLFAQAAEAFGTAGDALGRGDSLIYLADCYRMLGAVAQARDALSEALGGPLPPARRAVALRGRVYEALAAGRWQQAIASLDEAIALIEQSGDRQALTELAVNLRSVVLLLPGGVERAERVRRLIEREPVPPFSLLRAADSFLRGAIHLQRGDVRAAYHDFQQAMRLNDQLGPLSTLSLETALGLLRCAALMDDFAAANRYADQLMAMLAHPTLAGYRHAWGAAYLSNIGWLRWLEQRDDAAHTIADEVDALANEQEWPAVKLIRRLLRALILLADGELGAAQAALHNAYSDQQHYRDSAVFVDAGALLAYTYLQAARDADAAALLNTLLARHEQRRTPGLLLLTGKTVVVPLLRFAVAQQVRTAFAGRTLRMVLHTSRAQPAEPEANAVPSAAPDPDALTEREREVLRLIAAGNSNSEIAARLIIGLATVKKHINHIFAKLRVESRTQALVRARERGLL